MVGAVHRPAVAAGRDGERAARAVRRRAVHRDVRRSASPGWSTVDTGDVLVDARPRRHPRRHPDRRPRRHDARLAARPGGVAPDRAHPAAAGQRRDEDRAARRGRLAAARRHHHVASGFEVAIARRPLPAVPDARRGAGARRPGTASSTRSPRSTTPASSRPRRASSRTVSDWWVLLPIIIGVFVGSLGFPVILNVLRRLAHPAALEPARQAHADHERSRSSWSGSVARGGVRVDQPATRSAARTGRHRCSPSLFAGVMPRSGGFSTVDVGEMHEGTWLLTDALMFVGGGSASTAGGIKVTTLAVMLLAIVAEARGDRDVEAFGRRIPREALQVAIAVLAGQRDARARSRRWLLLAITGRDPRRRAVRGHLGVRHRAACPPASPPTCRTPASTCSPRSCSSAVPAR